MKKYLFILVIVVLFSVTSFAKTDNGVYDEAKRTIELLNNTRRKLNLDTFTIDKSLKNMANDHSKYMSQNKIFSSVESSTKSNYRGRYPWDRANYAGYNDSYVYEFIVRRINNFNSGIEEIMADPLNRSIILNPVYKKIGMGIENGYGTFVIGGNKVNTNMFVTYPYNGQKKVKSVNRSSRYSNYLKSSNMKADKYIGTPITISYYGDTVSSAKNVKVVLREKNSRKRINTFVLKPKDYYLLDRTLLILPLEKYDYGKKYELLVSFDLQLKNGKIRKYNKVTNFTTDYYKKQSSQVKFITRGKFTELLVKNQKYRLIEPLEFKFADVKLNDPRSKYIYTATSKKLITGFSNGLFAPELNINKEQAYTILVRAYERKNGTIKVSRRDNSYANYITNISPWALKYIKKAKKIGILLEDGQKANAKGYLTESDYKEILNRFDKSKK